MYFRRFSEDCVSCLNPQDLRASVRVADILRSLATGAASRLSIERHRRELGVKHETARKIIMILEDLHIVRLLGNYQPEADVVSSTRQRKLHFTDSGMLAAVLGVTEATLGQLPRNRQLAGMLLETFVCSEIAKQINVCDAGHRLSYWSDRYHEVDLVVQFEGGIVGVEVKSGANARGDDFTGLKRLADLAGNMRRGVVIHTGGEAAGFAYRPDGTGPRQVPMQAVPVSWLWMPPRGAQPDLFSW